MLYYPLIQAAQAGVAQSGAPQGSAMSMVVMLGVMFAIIYFLMIRPQQKQQKRHRDFLGKLKKGDDVLTQAGLLGRVFAVEENIVTLEVADKVRVRVVKQAITGAQPGTAPAADDGKDSGKK